MYIEVWYGTVCLHASVKQSYRWNSVLYNYIAVHGAKKHMKFVCVLQFCEAVHYSSAFPNAVCCLVYFLIYSAVLAVFLCIQCR